MQRKILSAKWDPFCPGGDELTAKFPFRMEDTLRLSVPSVSSVSSVKHIRQFQSVQSDIHGRGGQCDVAQQPTQPLCLKKKIRFINLRAAQWNDGGMEIALRILLIVTSGIISCTRPANVSYCRGSKPHYSPNAVVCVRNYNGGSRPWIKC